MPWTVYNSDGQILQGSSTLADDAVTTAKILDDAVTYAKMQNLATADRVLGSASTGVIGEVQIVEDMIADDAVTYAKLQNLGTADRVLGSTSTGVIGEVQIVPDMLASNAVTTAKILDANVTLAKMASQSVDEDNLYISNAGSNGEFLSKQSGNNGGLTWAAAGGDLSFGGDTFGADKVIGSNDAYALSFETAGTVRMKIHGQVTSPTSAGAITMDSQPTMGAYGNSGQANVTGNAAVYILLLTEIWDVGGNFTSNTFTAPVTGKYQVSCQVELECTGATQTTCYISTSNRDWHTYSGGEYFAFKSIATVDMDAGDTVTCKIQATGTGLTSDINSGGVTSPRSFMTCWLQG